MRKTATIPNNPNVDWYWSVLGNQQGYYNFLIQKWQFAKKKFPFLIKYTGAVSRWAGKFFPPITEPLDVELPWFGTLRLPANSPSNRTYLAKRYELDVVEKIKSLSLKGTTAIDIGAHAGYYSRLLVDLGAYVVAFEPNPTSFRYLNRNMAGYTWEAREEENFSHTLEECALSYHSGNAYLSDVNDLEHGRVMKEGTYSIPVKTLDDYWDMFETEVSLIKIDVEGGEAGVLAGADAFLTAHRETALILEYAPIFLNQLGMEQSSWKLLSGTLKHYGFSQYEVLEQGTKHALEEGAFPYSGDVACFNLYFPPRRPVALS